MGRLPCQSSHENVSGHAATPLVALCFPCVYPRTSQTCQQQVPRRRRWRVPWWACWRLSRGPAGLGPDTCGVPGCSRAWGPCGKRWGGPRRGGRLGGALAKEVAWGGLGIGKTAGSKTLPDSYLTLPTCPQKEQHHPTSRKFNIRCVLKITTLIGWWIDWWIDWYIDWWID